MKINSASFVISAVKRDQYPVTDNPEVAFVGRSNVGKSSLINTLVNRKGLVKTSGKPGKTRLINFFLVNDSFHLVDLPGYGYAAVSNSIQKQWADFIETYLKEREVLQLVVQLVDMRHEPTELDKQMHQWLKHFEIPVLLVATKADKIARGKWPAHLDRIRKKIGLASEEVIIPFSAMTRQGKEDIWKVIANYLK